MCSVPKTSRIYWTCDKRKRCGYRPKKIEVVKRFLSNTFFFCSYYRKFVQGFSTIAKPLHKLTEKGVNFRWTEECETSFMRLKNVLTDSPILAYLKSEGLFVLDTDASAFSVGAVLSKSRRATKKLSPI